MIGGRLQKNLRLLHAEPLTYLLMTLVNFATFFFPKNPLSRYPDMDISPPEVV